VGRRGSGRSCVEQQVVTAQLGRLRAPEGVAPVGLLLRVLLQDVAGLGLAAQSGVGAGDANGAAAVHCARAGGWASWVDFGQQLVLLGKGVVQGVVGCLRLTRGRIVLQAERGTCLLPEVCGVHLEHSKQDGWETAKIDFPAHWAWSFGPIDKTFTFDPGRRSVLPTASGGCLAKAS